MQRRLSRRAAMTGAATAAAAVGLAGCLQNPDSSGGTTATAEKYTEGDVPGSGTVTVLGAFGGQEQEAFLASLEDFEKESGVTVQYTADTDFTNTIRQRAGSGDAPDVALFPQPGGLFDLARGGKVVPIDVYLDYDALDGTLIPGFLDSARLQGRVYGAPMRMACKSLIWYPKAAYEEGGYSAEPATMQELYGIADEIKADGITPWSDGWAADQATGWVGTDWIEELMLRVHGPDVYDDWIYHRMPFNDEKVVQVFDLLGDLLKGEGNVLGGTDTILNTPFSEAPLPLFEDPPKAMYVRQGNFVTGFFPEDVQKNLDSEVGVFAMPTWEGGFDGQPILGGGDLAALFTLNDDSVKLMRFLSSPEFGGPWAQAGGWLSPHTTFDASQYPDEITRQVAEIASGAQVFRYDGSDVMPGAVGGGSFWTGMVEWLKGSKDSQQVCDEIEAGWPK
ncbi:carbohydrate ABC transporter substrate-binding protein [Brachybacterium sp. SGAir0954]|uniref:ABC transporter substrate-binding protein n=1 Tax=Brachybacterium sp. SGAir0954 TaxID=2571029 RepID=UPI0010CD3EE9|nr:ABC transporter substrate-binding protein [Brachybacterium sp. SGAir0954]QCR53123.1 carbohydrate ABC transporter substrate-binding protein [Brachybacterium sp. SGAir0954]